MAIDSGNFVPDPLDADQDHRVQVSGSFLGAASTRPSEHPESEKPEGFCPSAGVVVALHAGVAAPIKATGAISSICLHTAITPITSVSVPPATPGFSSLPFSHPAYVPLPKDPRFTTRGPTSGKLKRLQTFGSDTHRFLSIEDAVDLITAFEQAEERNQPLNAHITMTFDGSGTSATDVERAVALQHTLLIDIRKQLGREEGDHPFACIWALETGETGLHLHVLLHIDPARWLSIKATLTSLLTRRLHDLRWPPETGQVAKRESRLGAAGWPKVRHGEYTQETRV